MHSALTLAKLQEVYRDNTGSELRQHPSRLMWRGRCPSCDAEDAFKVFASDDGAVSQWGCACWEAHPERRDNWHRSVGLRTVPPKAAPAAERAYQVERDTPSSSQGRPV